MVKKSFVAAKSSRIKNVFSIPQSPLRETLRGLCFPQSPLRETLRGLCFIACILLASCNNNGKPDVSNIKVDLHVLRFDKDLRSLDANNYDSQFALLNSKYPDFLPFYLKAVAQVIRSSDTTIHKDTLLHYLSDSYLKYVSDTVEKQFADIKPLEADLTQAFKYLKHYFPQVPTPVVVTYIDGPPYGLTYGDIIGIGLDGYLGTAFPPYTQRPDPIPVFALRKFDKKYILPNTMNVLATGMYPFDINSHKLLDAMIHNGKALYFMKMMLPDMQDSLIFGYPDSSMKWINTNEPEIWKFFVQNKLLYETDPLVFTKFVSDAPNTSGMPAQAPGNLGSWIGFRIVNKYMQRNTDITLSQLMKEEDAQKILTESRYKPQ